MPKNVQSEWEIVTLSPVLYLIVDFRKVVNDLFHARFTLVESEKKERKTRLSE